MIALKDYVINLLPDYIIDHDSYKDSDGKGFVQRYLEIFGAELDEQYYPLIEQIIDNVDPRQVLKADYLDYISVMIGDTPTIALTDDNYKNLLTFIISLYKAKGTHRSYDYGFYMLKMEATVNEIDEVANTYDDTISYDADFNYDISCEPCSEYDLVLTGTDTFTADLYHRVKTIIFLIEPINATLNDLSYNGDVIDAMVIEVTVDENGDLIYNNEADPSLTLSLDENGDLTIGGDNAHRYYIDENGDLIYLS